MTTPAAQKKLALVLSGGGARGAYEAGVLHYIRSQAEFDPVFARNFDIVTGSSVGAINACFMAATAHNIKYQAKHIFEIWKSLKQENVYKRDVSTLAKLMMRSFSAITRNLFRRHNSIREFHIEQKHFRGLFNTQPLGEYMASVVPWKQIQLNIENGLLDALCITATQVLSGGVELFIQKRKDISYTGNYTWHETKIEHHHALASSAIPLVFPTIKIHSHDYMDGGLRLNTPMSPAIQLHADKILVISPHDRTKAASTTSAALPDNLFSYVPAPSLGLVFGKLLNSIFLDKLDYDIEQMQRINRIIDWGESCFGDDFMTQVNSFLKQQSITGDIANRGLKRLEVLEIYPSQDIREIFAASVDRNDFFKNELSSFEKTLLKVLDVDLSTGKDFLSYIMFHPQYLSRLLDLGFADAKARHEDIRAFLL